MDGVRAGVWIDRRQAFIILPKDSDCDVIQIESEVEGKHRSTGGKRKSRPYMHENGDSSEAHFDNANRSRLYKYLEKVAEVLEEANHVYILGPGRTKGILKKILMQAENIYGMLDIDVETAEHLTVPQLKAKVLAHFDKSKKRVRREAPGSQPAAY